MLHGAGTIGGVDGICFFSLMHRAYFTSSYYGFRLSGMVDTVEEFTLLLTHGSQRMDPEDLATTLGRSRDNAPYEDTYDFGCTNGLISTMPIGARTSRRVGPVSVTPLSSSENGCDMLDAGESCPCMHASHG